jgi:hypothetical protein
MAKHDRHAEAITESCAAGCRLLVDHGADPNRAPLYRMTPLEWAQRSPAGKDGELVAILS